MGHSVPSSKLIILFAEVAWSASDISVSVQDSLHSRGCCNEGGIEESVTKHMAGILTKPLSISLDLLIFFSVLLAVAFRLLYWGRHNVVHEHCRSVYSQLYTHKCA